MVDKIDYLVELAKIGENLGKTADNVSNPNRAIVKQDTIGALNILYELNNNLLAMAKELYHVIDLV